VLVSLGGVTFADVRREGIGAEQVPFDERHVHLNAMDVLAKLGEV